MDAEKRLILVLMGPPGCGKGTQAKMLTETFGIRQISTGDMLREARAADSEIGRRSSVFMDAGTMVPDEIVIDLVAMRIQNRDCAGGFILDGFPRTLAQAQALDEMLGHRKLAIGQVLFFDVPDEEIVVRITGRVSCVLCGKIYHTTFNPPPTADTCACGGYLLQRPDDNVTTVTSRLAAYRESTEPLVRYYTDKGILATIHGGGSTIEQVSGRVMERMAAITGAR